MNKKEFIEVTTFNLDEAYGEYYYPHESDDRTSTERSLDLAARSLHAIADTLIRIYDDSRHA